jgi:anaerobic selenocysteine-containing dehydrogenase
MPDQRRVLDGLSREDLFTVVFDQVMTDTAMYADIALPATTFLEHYDFARGYGPISLQIVKPVIEPVGDARSNVEVFSDLRDRLGLRRPDDPTDDLEMTLRILDALPETVARGLRADGVADPPPGVGATPVQFADVFPWTDDGKVHLFDEALDRTTPAGLYGYQPDPGDDRYPLALISPATDKTISSSLGELREGVSRLMINPIDARARSLAEDDEVRVYNALGEVRCLATISPEVRAGVVVLPKGLWRKHTLNGLTSNALVPDSLADLAGGACFNDARVEVERIDRPTSGAIH